MTSTPRSVKISVFFHLKLVGKISAALALTAAAGLAMVIALLASDKGANYREIIAAYGVAHENLQLALLVFGLAMVVVAALTTWLVTLYASFGFAGPLYRFSRNLELVTEQGPVAPVPLRAADQLQRECDAFHDCVGELRLHYSDLTDLVLRFESAMAGGDTDELRLALARLQDAERRARL